MERKFDLKELLRHFYKIEDIEEVTLGNYSALYLLRADRKSRMEYFIFEMDDVQSVSDEEIEKLVKSSPKFTSGLSIYRGKKEKYLYVCFNRVAYFQNLDMFDKTFLNKTKDAKIQRAFHEGAGWNPDPKRYKFIWWVFHNGVKSDNLKALMKTQESRFLDFEKVESFIETLKAQNKPYAYVCKGYPRLGVKAFDYARMQKNKPGIEFAPAWEEDPEREEILEIYRRIKQHEVS